MRHIGIQHLANRAIGYGRMGSDISKALRDLGVNVYDWTQGWEKHITPSKDIKNPGRPRTVVFVSPGTHIKGWFEGQHTVAYTMWEATKLPESQRELLHEYDQIIVPSEANLELYSQHHPNVSYVPLGVGPEWHYRPRDPLTYDNATDHEGNFAIATSSPAFRFLTAGAGPLRKGVDLTAAAFRMAFPDRLVLSPRPELIYKSPLGVHMQGATQHVEGFLTDAEEIELYEGAHVYVSAARGEGFGLQPLQAMAMGIPTILTNAHGHAAFAHLGIPVEAKLVPAPESMGWGEAGEWWEVSIEELAATMRDVYEDYARYVLKARASSAIVHQQFSWDMTAKGLLAVIGDEWLDEYPSLNLDRGWNSDRVMFSEAGEPTFVIDRWHALEPMKYLIRVTAPWSGNSAGVEYRFEPGTDYWDVADIKRIIHRMGFLDPSCIDADGVVNADPRLSGSHAYCPTCLQRIGSGIHKADDVLAAINRAT